MKKRLKNYYLIFDAFGLIPIWTLQHPIKGAEDAYLIEPKKFKIIDLLFKLEKSSPAFLISIDADIIYKDERLKRENVKLVEQIKFRKISLEPDEEYWE